MCGFTFSLLSVIKTYPSGDTRPDMGLIIRAESWQGGVAILMEWGFFMGQIRKARGVFIYG